MNESVLDALDVKKPCTASWEQMRGDDRTRFCSQCQKNVYDLSQLTRAEAEALILAREGRLCIRFFRRSDGRIMTKDCATITSIFRSERYLGAAVAFLALVLLIVARAFAEPGDDEGLVEPFRTIARWLSPSIGNRTFTNVTGTPAGPLIKPPAPDQASDDAAK